MRKALFRLAIIHDTTAFIIASRFNCPTTPKSPSPSSEAAPIHRLDNVSRDVDREGIDAWGLQNRIWATLPVNVLRLIFGCMALANCAASLMFEMPRTSGLDESTQKIA